MGDFKRCVSQFKTPEGRTWSEVYYAANSASDLKTVKTEAEKLLPLRCKMFAKGVVFLNAYVSDDDEVRDSLPLERPVPGPNEVWNSGLTLPASASQDVPDFAWTTLLVRMTSGNRSTKASYIGGIPDSYTVNTLNATVNHPEWMKAYNAWVKALVAKWAWKGQDGGLVSNPAKNIKTILDNGGKFQFETTENHGFNVGDSVGIYKVRGSGGRANGWQTVLTKESDTKFTTKRPIPEEYEYLAGGYAQKRKYKLYAIEEATIVRITSRKRGASIGLVRGRARTRK